jgi:glycosyltransferase involved in cell wall biosynthesis
MSTYRRNRPSSDCPNLLRRAIESVLSQTFTDFELILIDDGSTDGSEAICREYADKDKRIKLTRFPKNSGLSAVRYNYGMKVATGDYFMFMFDDDRWFPNAIADLYGAITTYHKDYGMVYGIIEWEAHKGRKDWLGSVWSSERILETNFIANLAVIVKREVINIVGGYEENPSFKRLCDWDLWQRIGKRFPVVQIPQLVGEVCLQPDGIGATVPLDREGMRKIQGFPNRVVTLQGELPPRPSRNKVIPPQVPTVLQEKKAIKRIVFTYSGHDAALVRWALVYLGDALKREGISVSIVNFATMNDELWAEGTDVIMVYRSFDLKTLHMMRRMKAQGKFVMFFLDDYLFQPNCKYLNIHVPMETIHEADCFVSSSARLLTKMPEKPKIHRRSVLDYESIKLLTQEYRRNKGEFNIGWLCGLGRTNKMDNFVYEMLQVLDSMIPEGIKCIFHSFGSRNYPQYSKLSINEQIYFAPEEWRSLYSKWTKLDLGVVINPLDESDEFNHCKSELKFVEAGAMGVPIITSRISPYTEFIKEGENGFFASTPEEYAWKLLTLLKDETLSRRVSENCNKYMLENYDVQKNAKQFLVDVEVAMKKQQQLRVNQHFGWPNIPGKPF